MAAVRSIPTRSRPKFAVLALAAVSSLCAAASPAAAQHFDEIALEFVDGLGFLDASVRPDVSNTGRVAFAGDESGTGADKIFVVSGEDRIAVDLAGFSNLENVEIDDYDDLVWTSDRSIAGVTYRGVYRSKLEERGPGVYPRYTLYQGRLFPFDAMKPPARRHVALSSHGEVLYSALTNGSGGLYKGPVEGVQPLYQAGPIYYNNIEIDLNEAGEVAAQLEYSDPIQNLSRGIFVWDAPIQPREAARTAVEKLGVGEQYAPDLNNAGQVAFVVDGSPTMTFYDPPDDQNGAIVAQIQLSPGIWLATPTPFGAPPILTQLVDTSTGFASFGDVLLDDFGRIVFSATKSLGGSGVYDGPDPVANKILEVGDIVDGRLYSVVSLGKGNDWGQFTLITSDFYTTDRQVWRVTPEPAPEPGMAMLLGAGVFGLGSLARRRSRHALRGASTISQPLVRRRALAASTCSI